MDTQPSVGILLIEDDALVQTVVSQHLRAHGYDVWIAPDAVAARALMDEHADSIGLLVVDSGLPVQSGESLAAELKERFGKTRVLIISGYDRPESDYPFLQKPFSGADLVERVDALLKVARQ